LLVFLLVFFVGFFCWFCWSMLFASLHPASWPLISLPQVSLVKNVYLSRAALI
jgi:hypothetical protein